MQGVLAGFATIGAVVFVGILLAHVRILDGGSQRMLARLAFFVASPALMIIVLGDTDVGKLFSANLLASIAGVAVSAITVVLLARLVWKRTASDTVIASFSAAYVNAGNLGLPIAGYVLGDASLVGPMLLTQLVILQPLGLAVLDLTTREGIPGISRRRRIVRLLIQPFEQPADDRFVARPAVVDLRSRSAEADPRSADPAGWNGHSGDADRVRSLAAPRPASRGR